MAARRRRSAWRLLLGLVVGLGVQVGALVLLGRHFVVAGGLILGAEMAMFVATAMLTPLPRAGFWWPWQRAARRRPDSYRRRAALDAGAGLDLLFFVSIFAIVLPGQVVDAWAQHLELDLGPNLVLTLGGDGVGLVLLYGILEVRRRRHSDRPGPLPGTVELRRRDRDDSG